MKNLARPDKVRPAASPPAFTLAIDVGGTGLKAAVLDAKGKLTGDRVRVDTPYPCPPKVMVNTLAKLVKPLAAFDRVSIGFPGYIRGDKVVTAPHFGNEIWHGFNLAKALGTELGKPVRLLNDADLQGLATIKGIGLELVITLGTGVGTALFRAGELMPHLELSHHPVNKSKTYNQFLGKKALDKIGKEKWNQRVERAIEILRGLFNYDTLYIGGGNSVNVTCKLAANTKIVSNENGLLGAFMLWNLKRSTR
ncbi:MAG: ROK family protein [Verrucomicrobiota bacterium]